MRKGIAFLTALLLALMSVSALAADYTLPEKMQKQLSIGSGLKGSFSLAEEGLEEEGQLLAALDRAQFELRGLALADGSELCYYIYQTDGGESEEQRNRTTLYGKDGVYYLESAFLPDVILSFAGLGAAADQLGQQTGENPPISSLALKVFEMLQGKQKTEWETVFAGYEQKTELWLSGFPVETNYLSDDTGRSLLEMSYSIPFSSVRSFLTEILESLLTDEQVRSLLEPLMTGEQKAVYLNPNLLYFYRQIIDGLQVEDDLTLTRISDTKTGASAVTRLRLPLDHRLFGYDFLQIEQVSGGAVTCRLTDDSKTLLLSWPENLSLEGSFDHELLFGRYQENRAETDPANLALRIRLTGAVSGPTAADEDGKTHENYDYTCEITQDPGVLGEEIPADALNPFETARLHANLHFSSKNAQQSPTTAELLLEGSQGEKTFSISGTFKTAAPWILTAIDPTGHVSLLEATPEERAAWWETWLKNAKEKAERMPEVQMPESAEQTVEQSAEQTMEQTAEQTAEQTVEKTE